MSLQEITKHVHRKECGTFDSAMEWKVIRIISGEVQIVSRLPPGAQTGNVITGETYDPDTFVMGIVIKYCPFCGVGITVAKTKIQTPAEIVGVECPKETGEMDKDVPCSECRHWSKCYQAIRENI